MNISANQKEKPVFQDRVISLSRVAKVVKGGRRFSFSVLVVSGNSNSKVGFGLGKANEVPDAIKKGAEQAKKKMLDIPIVNGTIPFKVIGRHGASSVIILPAKKGKGIIAGGAVRSVMTLAGVLDVVCKAHGSKNPGNILRATIDGLEQLIDFNK